MNGALLNRLVSRRQFIKKCRDLSLLIGGSLAFSREIAEGFIKLATEPLALVFIQGQNCLGCTISLTYGNEYEFNDFVQRIVNLQVHPALSFSQGDSFVKALEQARDRGGYILVIEGSVPIAIKEACYLGEHPLADVLTDYAGAASTIICSGTCSSYGGIPSSGDNELGVIAAAEFIRQQQLDVPLIQIPGCPVHPDHLMGTIAYISATGSLPPMKELLPSQYFAESIHNHCGRFQHFTQDRYLTDYATEPSYCLLKQGCRGPITHSDCPSRRWNGKVSSCIESSSPCIGCKNKEWPFKDKLYLSAKNFEDIPWSMMKTRSQKH